MNDNEDLSWLAFCYVADELDSQQRGLFEIRLATDQTARDAVVRAHELADCVVAVSGPVGESANCLPGIPTASVLAADATAVGGWMPRVIGVAMGTAVCFLLVVGGVRWYRSAGDSDETPFASATDAGMADLATIWDETREPLDKPLWLDQHDEMDDFPPLENVNRIIDEQPSAWVQAAVFGMAGRKDDIAEDFELHGESEPTGTL